MLNQEIVDELKLPIYNVWAQVGYDVLDAIDPDDNEAMIETCIDCDRLLAANAPRAAVLVSELYREHGQSAVCQFLSEHISLA